MCLDLGKDKVCARVSFTGFDRVLLTITDPRQPKYRDRVMRAVAAMNHPASTTRGMIRPASKKWRGNTSQKVKQCKL